jgi:F-type H+-transporting ATPase subunit delta
MQKVVQLVAQFLIEKKQVRLLDVMLNDIEYYLALEHGQETVHVTTAYPLTDELRKKLLARFGTHAQLSLDETLDPTILGGVIVQTANKQFDGSLRTAVQKLKTIEVI